MGIRYSSAWRRSGCASGYGRKRRARRSSTGDCRRRRGVPTRRVLQPGHVLAEIGGTEDPLAPQPDQRIRLLRIPPAQRRSPEAHGHHRPGRGMEWRRVRKRSRITRPARERAAPRRSAPRREQHQHRSSPIGDAARGRHAAHRPRGSARRADTRGGLSDPEGRAPPRAAGAARSHRSALSSRWPAPCLGRTARSARRRVGSSGLRRESGGHRGRVVDEVAGSVDPQARLDLLAGRGRKKMSSNPSAAVACTPTPAGRLRERSASIAGSREVDACGLEQRIPDREALVGAARERIRRAERVGGRGQHVTPGRPSPPGSRRCGR